MRPLPLLLFLAVGCGASGSTDSARPARARNVLLIVVDTLRRDHLGCYGYPGGTSPAIDALAQDAIRYDAALSTAPWTTPAIGALLTSEFPSMLGIEDDRSVLADEHQLLSELLAEAGYQTAAVVSHSFCSSEWNFDQGFASFDDSQVLGPAGSSSPEVTRRALRFLEQRDPRRPFFLWLHYFDPHWRYEPHPGFERRDPSYQGRIVHGLPMRVLRTLVPTLSEDDVAELLRQYDEEIAFTDHHVGRVLARLTELGLDQDTLVVFTSDHGEEFLDHGDLGHAHTLHDEVVGVPLLVRIPGETPRVVTTPVSTIDVLPTVLDVLGLPPAPRAVGRSLLERERDALAFSETARRARLRSVRSEAWTLVLDLESGRRRLYDRVADPLEQRDLWEERGRDAGVRRLVEQLDAFGALLDARASEGASIELSAEQEAELRALGYGE